MFGQGFDIKDGQARIQLLNFMAEGGDDRARISDRADDECPIIAGVPNVALQQRAVNERPRLFTQAEILAVPGDPDDFDRRLFASGAESLADGALPRPEAPGEGFVDDRHRRRIFFVLRREIASGDERNAHRCEGIQSDAALHRFGNAGVARGRLPFWINANAQVVEAEWQETGNRIRPHSWKRLDARGELAVKLLLSFAKTSSCSKMPRLGFM